MMVRAGFTAPHDGKKLPSTTHVEIVHLVSPAMNVEGRAPRVAFEASADRVSDPGQGDSLARGEAPRPQAFVALEAVDAAPGLPCHQPLQRLDEALVPRLVVWLVGKDSAAIPVQGNPVVRIRQVLGCQPEVERVTGHQVERPPRRDRGGAPARSEWASSFPTKEMWPIAKGHSSDPK